LKVHARSSLIIDVDCVLEDVEIDGHYEIKEGGNITVKHMDKDYHSLEHLKEEDQEPHLKIRGYKLKKHHKHAKWWVRIIHHNNRYMLKDKIKPGSTFLFSIIRILLIVFSLTGVALIAVAIWFWT